MSVKSKKSAGEIDRPFAADVAARAKEIAERYQVILAFEDGHWYGRGLEMPHVFGDGKTANQCTASTREALIAAVAYLLETGQRPPAPASAGRRTMQVNVRLTPDEKALLEATARSKGFGSLADFIRTAAAEAAH